MRKVLLFGLGKKGDFKHSSRLSKPSYFSPEKRPSRNKLPDPYLKVYLVEQSIKVFLCKLLDSVISTTGTLVVPIFSTG